MTATPVLLSEVAQNLIEARRWYDAQPPCLNGVLGHRFHQGFAEWESGELPGSVRSMFGPDYYFSRLEVAQDGKLFAVFLDLDTSSEEGAKRIEVAPAHPIARRQSPISPQELVDLRDRVQRALVEWSTAHQRLTEGIGDPIDPETHEWSLEDGSHISIDILVGDPAARVNHSIEIHLDHP